VFTDYLARSNIEMRSGSDYQELVKRSGSDPDARKALLARQRARELMFGSEAKLEALADVLDDHCDERIIVFTAHNDLAYDVSERFLVPTITHQTGTTERREILERFREGTYTRVATSNVLDEGSTFPTRTWRSCSRAAAASGSSSSDSDESFARNPMADGRPSMRLSPKIPARNGSQVVVATNDRRTADTPVPDRISRFGPVDSFCVRYSREPYSAEAAGSRQLPVLC